uniref:Ribosomal protein S14 n=1 Tax=Cynomorium coccineum TaxID=51503 RepID=A0A1B1LNC9_9MAGN|nr:ribosomal protein S14 [Cynomorium coccineum]
MRLYHRGAAFCKKMRGKLSQMSEKRNIRDHKRRLDCSRLKNKSLIIYKAFIEVKIPIFLVICETNIVISCQERFNYMHEKETDLFPRVALVPYIRSFEFIVSFFAFRGPLIGINSLGSNHQTNRTRVSSAAGPQAR